LDLYNILSKSDTDLRQPVGLADQLLKDNEMDTEVGKSMLQLLKVHLCCQTCRCHTYLALLLLCSEPQVIMSS